MKPSTRILSLLGELFFGESSGFGDDATNYNNSGKEKFIKGDFDDAIADYNKAIELKSDYVDAYWNRGLVKEAKGDLAGALSDCNKAIELNPKFAAAYYSRGFMKRAKGDLDGSNADFKRAIELKPRLRKLIESAVN